MSEPMDAFLACTVLSKQHLGAQVYEVVLERPPESPFLAGQYLQVKLDDGTLVPYSIASAPEELGTLTLHIQNQGEESLSEVVLERLQAGAWVDLRIGMGDTLLRPDTLAPDDPLILVAAGTGFAQMKAIIESAIEQDLANPIWLYWGARAPELLYHLDLAESWTESLPQLQFVPVVSDLSIGWLGRTGLVHQAVLEDFEDLSDAWVYLCGSPQMVYAAEDDFMARGLRADRIFSDVFAYAPRPDS